tara:strand:- start:1394 stop:1642 length:249 start_codon:yes stop_codon:yes gene_type:complete
MPTYEDSNVQQHVAENKETKTVDVSVYWRWEDNKQIEVPADMELDEVRDMIVWDNDFDVNSACLVEFDVSNVADDEGNEWSL